jgi:alanine-glyoxylate transaminase/serine-glyoxylate transaminase/serine-pyruvate transaminase
MLNAIKIPEGVDDAGVRAILLKDYHIEIGGGLGPLAGKIWRIGLMGETAKKENIQKLMDAFRKIIN